MLWKSLTSLSVLNFKWKSFPETYSFFQISHVFRILLIFPAVDVETDINRYRGRETENRQRRRASLSEADLTVSTLIASDQHYHTCYQQAPPLLEYLNILKSQTARSGGLSTSLRLLIAAPLHWCDNGATTALFIFINAVLITYEQKCLLE